MNKPQAAKLLSKTMVCSLISWRYSMIHIPFKFSGFSFTFKILICLIDLNSAYQPLKAQSYESKAIVYNTLVGGVTAGIGAIINKHEHQKWYKAFAKGFVIGIGGGAVVYSGKRLNSLIAFNQNIGYGYLSRVVFSAGNSIVENAAANRDFWSVWHYDVGFIRMEFNTKSLRLQPKLLASAFGGTVFMAIHGRFDFKTTIRSGTVTFRTPEIKYSPNFSASTVTNGFLMNDTLRNGKPYYDIFAHEMNHTFQFQEFSGLNYYFNPLKNKWKMKYPNFEKLNRWIYGDLNYEAFLLNYFIIQRGYQGKGYCKNYLENEAEFLSVGKTACDEHP